MEPESGWTLSSPMSSRNGSTWSMLKRETTTLVRDTRSNIGLVWRATVLLWLIELADLVVLGGGLDAWGVRPRSIGGLVGLVTAPFLHGGVAHLAANTIPLLVLGALTMTRKRLDFWVVSVVSAILAGGGAWLFGAPNTVHIGASGVIFGYFGFLLARGIYERSLRAVFMSLFVGWAFGGMLMGVLPLVGAGISWQSHLFGFLGGALTARFLGARIREGRD